MSQVYLFLAPGFEEIEALTVVDLLRRAGISIATVSIHNTLSVTGAHDITVNADLMFDDTDFSTANMLVLPGGSPGTCNLNAFDPLKVLLNDFYSNKKYIAAICAAPMILGHLGFLKNRKATCYPGFEKDLVGAFHCTEPVVVDGTVITSRGLGTAIEFASTLIAKLKDATTSEQIKKQIIY